MPNEKTKKHYSSRRSNYSSSQRSSSESSSSALVPLPPKKESSYALAAERRRRSTSANNKLELSIADPETGMTRLMAERAEQREIDRRKQRIARKELDSIEENVRRK